MNRPPIASRIPSPTEPDRVGPGFFARGGSSRLPHPIATTPPYMICHMDTPTPHQFTDHYTFDADFRGETLYYLEAGRKADMQWTWSSAYRIYKSSLTAWTNHDGSRTPITDAERDEIVRRAIKYSADVQHVKLIVEP